MSNTQPSQTKNRFRKRPVEIQAVLWTGYNMDEVWAMDEAKTQPFTIDGEAVMIHTLEGVMRCEKGDWIIRGVKGEFYPCKPDIFEATYERVR